MSSLLPPPLPGDIVADYKLIETLGIGGNATVYRAISIHESSGEEIALKILHPGKTSLEDTKRLQREFLSLQAINHPNIVRVYNSGVHENYPWLAMELVQGKDLNQLIKIWDTQPTTERFTIIEKVLIDLCHALNYVHQRGMIHRDLKPSNILISEQGVAKLTDFGVVKAEAFLSELTTMGRLVGTVAFMAPEHIMGEPCDLRSDLYSLGALLYMGLTGKKPFEATSIAGYLSMHLTHDAPNPQSIDPNIPDHLNNICNKLLQKEPDQRFSSASEILQLLKKEPTVVELFGRNQLIEKFRRLILRFQEGDSIHLALSGTHKSGKTALLLRLKQELLSQGLRVQTLSEVENRDDLDSCVICLDDMEQYPQITSKIAEIGNMGTQIFLISTSLIHISLPPFFSHTLHWPINPLSFEQTQDLLRSKNIIGPALVVLSQRLHDEYQGNVGYILESVAQILEQDWLKKTPLGKYKSDLSMDELKHKPIPVPKSLKKLLQESLASLSLENKHILECMVVFERPITIPILSICSNKPPENLHTIIAQLTPEWIEQKGDKIHGKPSLFFPLYNLLSSERKQAWHQRISSVLVKQSRRNITEMAEDIAHHLLKSNQLTTAFPFLISAAQHQYQNNNILVAKEFLTQAQEILPIINEKLPLSKAKLSLFELLGYIHKKEKLLSKACVFFEQAAQQAQIIGNNTLYLLLCAHKEVCMLKLGHPPIELSNVLSQINPTESIWKEGTQELALYYFDHNREEQGRLLLEELSRSEDLHEQAFLSFYTALWDLTTQQISSALREVTRHKSAFGLHWDIFIVHGLILTGNWDEGLKLLAKIQISSRQVLDPAHSCYAYALQAHIFCLLGEKEKAIESYREARLISMQYKSPNSLRAFILLQRLSFVLQMRIPADEQDISLPFSIIDDIETQQKYLLAKVTKKPLTRPPKMLPFVYCFLIVDHIMSFSDLEDKKRELSTLWEDPYTHQFPFLSLWISKLGNAVFTDETWNNRFQEQIIYFISKQPQYFHIQEHWHNR